MNAIEMLHKAATEPETGQYRSSRVEHAQMRVSSLSRFYDCEFYACHIFCDFPIVGHDCGTGIVKVCEIDEHFSKEFFAVFDKCNFIDCVLDDSKSRASP